MSYFPRFLFLIFILTNYKYSFSASIVENFQTNTHKDASTTADWNSSLGQAIPDGITVFTSNGNDTFDAGDESDGPCHYQSDTTLSGGIYNCTTLTITAGVTVDTAGGSTPIIFKARGNVLINGILDFDGKNGENGIDSSPATSFGGNSASGGENGGDSISTADGGDGNGAGFGSGGTAAGGNGTADGGGGGGGAAHANSNATSGLDGNGTSKGLGGLSGSDYGDQKDFTTTFQGGSGGGSGGPGNNWTILSSGGGGGGSGGAIKISAIGDITINGMVSANGGDGGPGAVYSGGGGGGSGGSIFLQARGDIIIAGTVMALSGNGGVAGTSNTGAGGDGGTGRIRMEDQDSSITGSSTPVPEFPSGTADVSNVKFQTSTYIVQSTGYDTEINTNKFTAPSIDHTVRTGTIKYFFSDSVDNNNWNAWVPMSNISSLSRRYIRFKAEIISDGTDGIIRSITINYESPQFKSGISCGTINTPSQSDGDGGLSILLSLICGIFLAGLSIPSNANQKSAL